MRERLVRFRSSFLCAVLASGIAFIGLPANGRAQLTLPDTDSKPAQSLLGDPTVNPGKMQLFELEARFAKDVRERGGAGFAEWFAEDGVALGNGAAPLIGKVAIQKSARWLPTVYQLTWTPTDGMMGPSGDVGYTWGHFEGRSKDANGNPVVTSGRYITVWRKQTDGAWKVVLDAGANEPAAAGDCCKLPAGS